MSLFKLIGTHMFNINNSAITNLHLDKDAWCCKRPLYVRIRHWLRHSNRKRSDYIEGTTGPTRMGTVRYVYVFSNLRGDHCTGTLKLVSD